MASAGVAEFEAIVDTNERVEQQIRAARAFLLQEPRRGRMPEDRESQNWRERPVAALPLRVEALHADQMVQSRLLRAAYTAALQELEESRDRLRRAVGGLERYPIDLENDGTEAGMVGEVPAEPGPAFPAVEERADRATDGTLPAPAELPVEAIRQATGEEEAWLEEQEWQTQEQEEWLAIQAEGNLEQHIVSGPGVEREAEEFDGREALEHWTRAQQEAMEMAEAETCRAIEEEQERELQELASAENVERHHMMRVLQKGAQHLLREEIEDGVSYEELLSVQYSAQRLVELVERGMHVVREKERQTLLREKAEALRLQAAAETAAIAERLVLQAEVSRLQGDQEALRQELEQERDKTVCRICFARPRDAIPLPCMHFDFCNQCLQQQQRRRNTCPTCRCTINGILKYNLSLTGYV